MLSEYPFSAFDIFQLFGPVVALFINRYKKKPTISEKMHFVQFFFIQGSSLGHRQLKLNIREPLNYKDLYGNTTDLCKMVETNIVFSIKSSYPVSTCILCHFPAFQAGLKRCR